MGTRERAVDRRIVAEVDGPETSALVEEGDGLRADKASLASELGRLRTQNRTLEALTDDVNLRLDGAIGEIRSVLK